MRIKSFPAASSRPWIAIIVLGVAAFAMVTTEFAPIGLLSAIAVDLHSSKSAIGTTVAFYAWLGAAGGLLSAFMFARISRRSLLVALMLTLAIANFATASASSLGIFCAARFVGALAHGVFWATVAATASKIAPPNRVGLATAIVFGGISAATVLGVPILNALGSALGWRYAFSLLSAACVFAAMLMSALLPPVHVPPQQHDQRFIHIFANRELLLIYAITAFTAAAHFGAYTFIEPFITVIPGIKQQTVSLMLFGFGAAGLAGTVATAAFADMFLKPLISLSLALMLCALLVLGFYGPAVGPVISMLALCVWGGAISILFAGLQAWVLRAAGPLQDSAAAFHTAMLNGAIGIGALAGARILATFGVSGTMLLAGLILAPGWLLISTGPVLKLATSNPSR